MLQVIFLFVQVHIGCFQYASGAVSLAGFVAKRRNRLDKSQNQGGHELVCKTKLNLSKG